MTSPPTIPATCVLTLLMGLGGCAHAGFSDLRCDWLPDSRAETTAAAARPALTAINPDFNRLRPFRSYVQILDVGPYEEHFSVWYSCIEPNVREFTARRGNGSRIVVEAGDGAWGGLAVRRSEPAPIPREVRDLARAVLDEVRRHVPDARNLRIAYGGAYRPVRVHEVVPAGLPEDGTARMASTAEVTLAANRDLTRLEGIIRMQGGITRLCWDDMNYVPCHGPARWVPLRTEAMQGSPLLRRFARDLRRGEADGQISAALLAGAREAAAGAPMHALEELHALEPAGGDADADATDGSLLLPGMRQQVQAQISIYARASHGDQVSAAAALRFDVGQATHGRATAEQTVDIAGHPYRIEGVLSARRPPPADARGSLELDFDIHLRFSDDAGHEETLDHSAHGTVVVDGALAATGSLTVEDGDPAPNQVGQPHLGLPGFSRFSSVDAYLGLTMPTAL